MNSVTPTIHLGMEVYTQDGERLGSIARIWPDVPVSSQGEPLTPWDQYQSDGDSGCIEVQDGGMLGVGVKHWYIPLQDITSVGRGDRLTIVTTQGECDERYMERPDFVDLDVT